jgi:hypothetical protein
MIQIFSWKWLMVSDFFDKGNILIFRRYQLHHHPDDAKEILEC